MNIEKKVKEIRKRFGLTQAQMADKLLMEQSTYSRYESGKTVPSIEIIKRISNTFSINIAWLLEIKDIDGHERSFFEENVTANQNFDSEFIQFVKDQQQKLNDLLKKWGK